MNQPIKYIFEYEVPALDNRVKWGKPHRAWITPSTRGTFRPFLYPENSTRELLRISRLQNRALLADVWFPATIRVSGRNTFDLLDLHGGQLFYLDDLWRQGRIKICLPRWQEELL